MRKNIPSKFNLAFLGFSLVFLVLFFAYTKTTEAAYSCQSVWTYGTPDTSGCYTKKQTGALCVNDPNGAYATQSDCRGVCTISNGVFLVCPVTYADCSQPGTEGQICGYPTIGTPSCAVQNGPSYCHQGQCNQFDFLDPGTVDTQPKDQMNIQFQNCSGGTGVCCAEPSNPNAAARNGITTDLVCGTTCPTTTVCGDKICDSGESSTCPQDCVTPAVNGVCNDSTPGACFSGSGTTPATAANGSGSTWTCNGTNGGDSDFCHVCNAGFYWDSSASACLADRYTSCATKNCSTDATCTTTHGQHGSDGSNCYINDNTCGGVNPECPIPLDGVCGDANNKKLSSLDQNSPQLCNAGLVESFNDLSQNGSGPWVWDCAGNGTADNSTVGCEATKATNPPTTPTGYSASPSTCGNNWLNIAWNGSTGAAPITYHVYRDGGATDIYNNSGFAFSDTGLVLGSTHSYTITASNANGTSPATASFSGTVSGACATNNPPSAPIITSLNTNPMTSPTTGFTGNSYPFTFKAVDGDTPPDNLRYGIDWNHDGIVDLWLPAVGYVTSGTAQTVSNSWATVGAKTFQAEAQDNLGGTSAWTPFTITLSTPQCTVATVAVDCGVSNTCTTYSCISGVCSSVTRPMDGGWSAWSTCQASTDTQTHTCTNPTPSCGGSLCKDSTGHLVTTETRPCPPMSYKEF